MHLTTDQMIQLGMLIAATVSLVAGGSAVLYRYRKSKAGVRLDSVVVGDGPFYLRRLESANHPDRAAVASVAGWTRLTITNNTEAPVVLNEIHACEADCAAPRNTVGKLFREARIQHQEVDLRLPVSLPMQVPSHDAIVLWTLIEIDLPGALGHLVFQRYLGLSVSERIREKTEELTSQVLEEAKASIKYAEVRGLAVESISMADPILRQRGDKYVVDQKFGLLPQSAMSELLSYCVEHNVDLPDISPLGRFRIEAILSDGRTLITDYSTGDDPFWFFKEKA